MAVALQKQQKERVRRAKANAWWDIIALFYHDRREENISIVESRDPGSWQSGLRESSGPDQ